MRKGRGGSRLEPRAATVQGGPRARAAHLYHTLEGVWALQPNCPHAVPALIYGIILGKLIGLRLNK